MKRALFFSAHAKFRLGIKKTLTYLLNQFKSIQFDKIRDQHRHKTKERRRMVDGQHRGKGRRTFQSTFG